MGNTQNLYPNIYRSLLEGRKCEFESLWADAEVEVILPKSWIRALAPELMCREERWAGMSRIVRKQVLKGCLKRWVTVSQWVSNLCLIASQSPCQTHDTVCFLAILLIILINSVWMIQFPNMRLYAPLCHQHENKWEGSAACTEIWVFCITVTFCTRQRMWTYLWAS